MAWERSVTFTCAKGARSANAAHCGFTTSRRESAEMIGEEYPAAVRTAFQDWLSKRAYLDSGGNYRVRADKRRIASWNKEVKRAFPSVREVHRAAVQYGQETKES